MHSSKKSEETMKSDFLPADEGVYNAISVTIGTGNPDLALNKPSFLSRKLTTLLSGHAAAPFNFD